MESTKKNGQIVTETLADLYLSQGMRKKAREIYARLLETNPHNEKLKKKLFRASHGNWLHDESDSSTSKCEKDSHVVHDTLDHDAALDAGFSIQGMSFEQLNDLYKKMGKERIEKKIVMLKKLLREFEKERLC